MNACGLLDIRGACRKITGRARIKDIADDNSLWRPFITRCKKSKNASNALCLVSSVHISADKQPTAFIIACHACMPALHKFPKQAWGLSSQMHRTLLPSCTCQGAHLSLCCVSSVPQAGVAAASTRSA